MSGSSPNTYDVIVVGLGGIGSATAYHLARRGMQVLGVDMHSRGHTFGSSHGHHRIIREAYFEAPEYVPVVQRAYTLWEELEAESGQSGLLRITGGLMFGKPDSEVITGSLRSAEVHNLRAERLVPDDVADRFPGFRLDNDMVAVYEPRAGYVQPERAIAAHLDLAKRHGAELNFEEEVTSWSQSGDGIEIVTPAGRYSARRLVLTTGPWASELLADLELPLTVRRIVNAHFQPQIPERFSEDHTPIFVINGDAGTYYGFPYIQGIGVKLGRHDSGEVTTARTIRREIDAQEIGHLRDVLDRYAPGASGDVLETLTCMYTMTPDEHFIVGQHPEHDHVVIGCGFSGHGYKFASALGEALSLLTLGEQTPVDMNFLSMERFAGTS